MHPYMLEKFIVATVQQLHREARSAEKVARGREASRLEVHRKASRDGRLREEPVAASE